MKCPYCNKEMALGYVQNGQQPVQWMPDGKKPSMLSHKTTKEGVTLVNEFAPFKANGYKAEAYYCMNCKIVIAPTIQ